MLKKLTLFLLFLALIQICVSDSNCENDINCMTCANNGTHGTNGTTCSQCFHGYQLNTGICI